MSRHVPDKVAVARGVHWAPQRGRFT